VTQNGTHEPNGGLGLSVNSFTPGDRQAPISLRWVERSHMGNLGQIASSLWEGAMSDVGGLAERVVPFLPSQIKQVQEVSTHPD
jgi:hypothetical protein